MKTTNSQTENNQKQEDALLLSLKIHPLKDGILFVVSILVIVLIFLVSYYSRPKTDPKTLFVQIKYQDTLLYDKNDPKKKTNISFPSEGEKKVSFTKEDGSLYLGEEKEFVFQGKGITFTLYDDYSIQVLHDDVECKDYDCSRQGRIYQPYLPIVCLPNTIQARIISTNAGFPEIDA